MVEATWGACQIPQQTRESATTTYDASFYYTFLCGPSSSGANANRKTEKQVGQSTAPVQVGSTIVTKKTRRHERKQTKQPVRSSSPRVFIQSPRGTCSVFLSFFSGTPFETSQPTNHYFLRRHSGGGNSSGADLIPDQKAVRGDHRHVLVPQNRAGDLGLNVGWDARALCVCVLVCLRC
jgi:hypothetical protein